MTPANAPPENGKGARHGAHSPHLTGHNASTIMAHVNRIKRLLALPAWYREADRLLGEYERTLDQKHFRALSRHVAGMREGSER